MKTNPPRTLWLLLAAGSLGAVAGGMDRVQFKQKDRDVTVEGKVVVAAQDGGQMLLGRDGTLWFIEPDQKLAQTKDDTPFEPLSPDALIPLVLADLPKGFDVHRTAHYLVFSDASREYAQWCGALFERLFVAFTNYWKTRGMKLSDPQFPLVAIVFADRKAYTEFSQNEVGDGAAATIGYFSLKKNRIITCDLTGIQSAGRGRNRRGSAAEINQLLNQPGAERTVATVVHEATHQIAFNCGLHTRFSDCPMWFSEGIAMYFETPDLDSAKGWRGIGNVNRVRLADFKAYLPHRPADSLQKLLGEDKRFRDAKTSGEAYSESWALTYFLMRQRSKQYQDYLTLLAKKPPLIWDTPEARLAEFAKIFGDIRKLDSEFVRYMVRVQ